MIGQKKAYLSSLVRSRIDDAYMARFNKAADKLKSEGYSIVSDSAILSIGKDTPLHFFAENIRAMADADLVVFQKDWNLVDLCMLEREIAIEFRKNIRILEES